jgi:flagella basal body P-ring formation protein FlgA
MRAFLVMVLGTLAFCMALATLPGAAVAAEPIQLRQDVTAPTGVVTLGDLFNEAGAAAGIVVARTRPGQMATLDATQVQIIARSNGVNWGNPAGLRRIIVQASAPAPTASAEAAPAKAEAKKAAKGPAVLAWLHSLNAGDIVRAEDLTWSREAVAGSEAPRDPDAVIGMAVRRPLREGDAVSLRDVSAPVVIKKDDVIAVSFQQDGLNLTLQGVKALSDAAAGQSLSVINPASKKILQVVALAPGQAVVGPAADQLKSAARLQSSSLAYPSRLALR